MQWLQIERHERHVLTRMLAEHRPSFLIDAILEGHLGNVIVDDKDCPHVAMLSHADVVVFAGNAAHVNARDLAAELPMVRAVLPCPKEWISLLKDVHGDRLVPVERFSLRDASLDLDHLRGLATQLPAGFSIYPIDETLARRILADPALISSDHISMFDSVEHFLAHGFGFCVIHDGDIVAGASTYAICDAGIEIQVNTREAFRGRGLATAVSAALVSHALEKGLTAHWDAANQTSVSLAGKLGYIPGDSYTVWVRIPS